MIAIPERSAGHLQGGLTGSAVFEENPAGDFTVSDTASSADSSDSVGSDSVSRFAPPSCR